MFRKLIIKNISYSQIQLIVSFELYLHLYMLDKFQSNQDHLLQNLYNVDT